MKSKISTKDLVLPFFLNAGENNKEPIKSLPGINRLSVDNLIEDIKEVRNLGINKVLLFGMGKNKDLSGSDAFNENGLVQQAVKAIKVQYKDIIVITDVCLCAYTSHGHCGILKSSNEVIIDNFNTIKTLAKIALSHARAGADWVAPSAMAKKQVLEIRKTLDKNGYTSTKILGYSAKFCSNFYGPFREAVNSSPKFGDRSGYQLNFSDAKKAIKEIQDDAKEGADAVMIKPALCYLDIIKEASSKVNLPLAAYNVSAEYAMVKAYCHSPDLEKKLVLEILTSIKRAGADLIITYHAKEVAKWLRA